MTALDEASEKYPAEMYFGGREPLMEVMSDDGSRSEEALKQAVKRSIDMLVGLGAVKRTNHARAGNRAVYRLTLDNPIDTEASRSRKQRQGVTPRPPQGVTPRPPQGVTPRPFRGSPGDPPRSNEEKLKEQQEESGVDLLLPLTVARTNGKESKMVTKRCDDPECELGYRFDPSKPKGQRNTPCPQCRPTPPVIAFPLERRNPFQQSTKIRHEL